MWPALKCISIRKTHTVDLGWVNISHVISSVSRQKFANFFLFNVGLTVLDNTFYLLSISLFVSKIFTVRLKNCRKSHQFLNIFICPPKFEGGGAPKSCTLVITPIWQHGTWQSFMKLLPLASTFLWLIRYILSQFLTFIL